MGALATVTNLLGGTLLDGVAKVIGVLKGKNSPESIAAANELEAMKEKFSSEFQLAQLQQQHDIIVASSQADQAQSDTNKAEATSSSLFVSGWRPLCGWICGAGLGYQFLVSPIGSWIAALCGKPVAAPTLDIGTLMTLLLGMLGMGAYRTYEKIQGVAPNAK